MADSIVVTGLGMLTPLGKSAGEVLSRIEAGEAASEPIPWPNAGFACPALARIHDFTPEQYIPEPKTARLMSRDALMAAGAARLAMEDAQLVAGRDCPAEEIALFGATGLAGLALAEVSRLVQLSAGEDGSLDLKRFGAVALKQVRPVLSFKILSNMPLCFVSIFQGIQGVNAVYNPWEGQGAQAIAAAVDAIRGGDATCALAGGCDVKTHELGFLALEQAGVFDSWRRSGRGCTPGEGAAFLVLERETFAVERRAHIYARIVEHRILCQNGSSRRADIYNRLLTQLGPIHTLLSASDGDPALADAEASALHEAGIQPQRQLRPKAHLGNLFAAAAAVQVGLAAAVASRAPSDARILANCFGHASEQAVFGLEAP